MVLFMGIALAESGNADHKSTEILDDDEVIDALTNYPKTSAGVVYFVAFLNVRSFITRAQIKSLDSQSSFLLFDFNYRC